MTVYGRTGTKLATAFNHGAAAVLLVPPAQPFRYVWENNARENMTLRDGNERQQLKAQALVSIDKAATIFAATGNDFERARAAAAAPGFRAVALSARVTITVTNQGNVPQSGSRGQRKSSNFREELAPRWTRTDAASAQREAAIVRQAGEPTSRSEVARRTGRFPQLVDPVSQVGLY